MSLLERDYINDVIDDVGVSLTVKDIDNTVNEWGDRDGAVKDNVSTSGVVEVIDSETAEEAEGDYQGGTVRVFLDPDTEYVTERNIIEINGHDYKINEVIEPAAGGPGETHIEALAEAV